jgi:phospholipid N-methyltransferase
VPTGIKVLSTVNLAPGILNMNTATFFLQAMQNPIQLGSIIPSSGHLTKLMMSNAKIDSASTVVELGPGTGVFTKKIISALPENSRYIGIEQNEKFARLLNMKFPAERTIHGSAEQLNQHLQDNDITQCDRIISGLPWLTFSESLQDRILSEISSALGSDGIFLTLAYSPFLYLPTGRKMKSKLNRHFGEVTRTENVFNIPPSSIYICRQPLMQS